MSPSPPKESFGLTSPTRGEEKEIFKCIILCGIYSAVKH
jgi:hypothetical protein